MFFKKLFNKDHLCYIEKGDRYLREERYADARDAFSLAIGILEKDGDSGSLRASILEKLTETGNRLGSLNLAEAEYALHRSELKKAGDHLALVLELAQDAALREKAAGLLEGLVVESAPQGLKDNSDSCAGCAKDTGELSRESHVGDEQLAEEDRFELSIQPLPGDLPKRYAALGAKFMNGYLLVHDGADEAASMIFEELRAVEENDILDYELALIHYRRGEAEKCESLLRRAIEMNGVNPLCYFGLVHLLAETGRVAEAMPFLELMLERELLPDQARLLLGDAYLMLEDENNATDCYTQVLSSPNFAKEAAGKLIPLLEKNGRAEDAGYLAKKFSKGCC
jgi:tetratricopeptide (TPR) repeat protein